MHLLVVGLNHKTAPVEIREKLHFPPNRLAEPLAELKAYDELLEKLILSTCNRVELYARVHHVYKGSQLVKQFLSDYHKVSLTDFEPYLYQFSDYDAVCHTFRVCSSLDSMIVGEPQISGQVKEAYNLAKEFGAVGPIIGQLFENAFHVAKKVRTETRIGESAISVSYAAVELSKKIFGDLADKSVMLIGAGEMSELAARHLVGNGVKTVFVSNRTHSRAVELAEELGGMAVNFEQMPQQLAAADIVISSTGAPHYIIKKEQVLNILKMRRSRPMFFIDIAVPRNIEPSVNEIDNVFLYNIDDLESVVEANLKERQREALKAEEIIKADVAKYMKWLDGLSIVPLIISLREKIDAIRRAELDKIFSKMNNFSQEEKKAIESLTSSIVNKILHPPIVNLKKQVNSTCSGEYLKVARDLFDLKK